MMAIDNALGFLASSSAAGSSDPWGSIWSSLNVAFGHLPFTSTISLLVSSTIRHTSSGRVSDAGNFGTLIAS